MTLPTITALPTPPNRATDTPTEFADNGDALLGALPQFVTELNAYGEGLADSNGVANYSATSATSLAIGTGTKNLTVTTGKRYLAGEFVTIASAANPTIDFMWGQVASYNSLTGAMVFDSQRVGIGASGTHADWQVSLSGINGEGGDTLPSFSGNGGYGLRLNAGGTLPVWQPNIAYVRQAADRSLTVTGTQQKLFDATTNGALTLAAGHYSFDLGLAITGMGSTGANDVLKILGAGTATLSTQLVWGSGLDAASAGAVQQFYSQIALATDTLTPVSGTVETVFSAHLRGTFAVTVAGTIIPSIALGSGAGGTVKAGSYFLCTYLGANAYLGNWS